MTHGYRCLAVLQRSAGSAKVQASYVRQHLWSQLHCCDAHVAGDIVGIASEGAKLDFLSPAGLLIHTASDINGPTALFPSSNGCDGRCATVLRVTITE
jgi:hypothetical protein